MHLRILFGLIIVTTLAPALLAEESPDQTDTLRVLVWNLWHGGNEVTDGPEKALRLIVESQADICLIQESHDIKGPRPKFGLWAAKELGWNAWIGTSSHLCVLTPYQIREKFLQAKKHCVGVELEDDQGRILHAFSVWIDSKDYTAYHLRDHLESTDTELLACESKRLA